MILTVSDTAKRKTRGSRKRPPMPGPTVTQATRERLYRDASTHPAFEGMPEHDIKTFIDAKLEIFLSKQPWWYGHLDDTKHRAAQRQYRARRDKEREAAAMAKKIDQQEHESALGNIREYEPGEEMKSRIEENEEPQLAAA